MSLSASSAYAAAVIGGVVLWQGTAWIGGRREAWDTSWYWTIAYPLVLVLSAVLAYAHPHRPWRFALAAMWAQALAMLLISPDSDWSLLPLGLIMFGVLAIPPMAVAGVAGAAAQRRRQQAPPPRP